MVDAADIVARLTRLRERLAAAGGDGVRVVAVTKALGVDAVHAATEAGLRDIGESYAQECVTKLADLQDRPTVHFIGRLQSNKVGRLAGIVDIWQSVDRVRLVDEIARRAPGATMLVQVDISGEDSKGGCHPSEIAMIVEHAEGAGLRVAGLMGIAPLGPPDTARPGFAALRALVDRHGLEECSMGMSGDVEVAVEEGATMVRVGTALFGPRPPG